MTSYYDIPAQLLDESFDACGQLYDGDNGDRQIALVTVIAPGAISVQYDDGSAPRTLSSSDVIRVRPF